MTLVSWLVIGTAILAGSFLSGVFGMAGGMVVIGVLLIYLDVATAMILFSIIQLGTNGWRAIHWRRFVLWPIFWWYILGAVIAFAAMRSIAFVPNKAVVYLLLGAMPFAVEALPTAWRPNIEWRGVPLITGALTTIVQFLSGVGGLFLDIFFQKSQLDRKTTNATKAVTQSFSHVLRGLYFGSLAGVGELSIQMWVPAVMLALIGSMLAPFVLERMTDHGFRQWTRGIIFIIAAVYLVRGAWILWSGTPG